MLKHVNLNNREEIAFFIEYCEAYISRMQMLKRDGDSEDEMRLSMKLYEPRLAKMANISIYEHPYPFDSRRRKKLKLDSITASARDDLFFKCLDYADSRIEIYESVRKTKADLVKDYIKLFGKPYNASELALAAETRGDSLLAELLED